MQVRTRRETSWRPLIRLLIDSKLPWWLYIFQLGLIYVGGRLSVYIVDVTGDLIAGNILDNSVLVNYSVMTLIEVGIGFMGIFGMWVSVLFESRIQTRVWESFLRLPIKVYEYLVPSTLISRITNDSIIVGRIIEQVINLINPIMIMTMFISQMLNYSTKLTWTVIPVVVFYTIFLFIGQNWIFSISFAVQENFAALTGYLAEKLGNIRLIKASGTESYETMRGQSINRERFHISMRGAKYQITLESFQSVMNLLLTGLVMIYGSTLISQGEMDIGGLISFYMFSMMIPNNFQMLLLSILDLQNTKGATTMVSEISNLEQESVQRNEAFPASKSDLSFENVSFSYDGEEPVLKNLSLVFPAGKTTAIIGPSGSGKTTILKLIERFYQPDEGRILIGNTDAEDIHLDDWREQFGYVIQNSPLLSGSVRDNVLYGAKQEVSEAELNQALEISNADHFINKMEDGLESDIGELGMNLSGGQRQRLAIARAIINQPDILLLDEATANMDSINESEITQAIKESMADKTLIVVAHHLKTITSADQIVVLDEGQVEAVGTHQELYQSSRLYRHLYDLQVELSNKRSKENES